MPGDINQEDSTITAGELRRVLRQSLDYHTRHAELEQGRYEDVQRNFPDLDLDNHNRIARSAPEKIAAAFETNARDSLMRGKPKPSLPPFEFHYDGERLVGFTFDGETHGQTGDRTDRRNRPSFANMTVDLQNSKSGWQSMFWAVASRISGRGREGREHFHETIDAQLALVKEAQELHTRASTATHTEFRLATPEGEAQVDALSLEFATSVVQQAQRRQDAETARSAANRCFMTLCQVDDDAIISIPGVNIKVMLGDALIDAAELQVLETQLSHHVESGSLQLAGVGGLETNSVSAPAHPSARVRGGAKQGK